MHEGKKKNTHRPIYAKEEDQSKSTKQVPKKNKKNKT